jgi:hypothetical protein
VGPRTLLAAGREARATACATPNGIRRAVQVIDGNYNVMDGVCPWWDSVKKSQKTG